MFALQRVLNLFVGQLEGIGKPAGASFARHFYLLEVLTAAWGPTRSHAGLLSHWLRQVLAVVKCFLTCADQEYASPMAASLFGLFFSIVR